MVPHETVGMAKPVELFYRPLLEMEELFPVPVVVKDHHLPGTPVYDMVKGTGELDSQRSGHS